LLRKIEACDAQFVRFILRCDSEANEPRVLSDALAGDRTLFAREDYVEEAWRVVDPVLRVDTELHVYEPGSWGPVETARFAPPGGWRDPMTH
jgi:glucose-6-phosphate 1-dehydrogenase